MARWIPSFSPALLLDCLKRFGEWTHFKLAPGCHVRTHLKSTRSFPFIAFRIRRVRRMRELFPDLLKYLWRINLVVQVTWTSFSRIERLLYPREPRTKPLRLQDKSSLLWIPRAVLIPIIPMPLLWNTWRGMPSMLALSCGFRIPFSLFEQRTLNPYLPLQ